MLDSIKKNTVSFIKNFDDSEIEPTVLPTLVPNILIIGATGIAAGYAPNNPPHNPNEVIEGMIFRIRNPNCNVEDLLKIIPGPDLMNIVFPRFTLEKSFGNIWSSKL